MGTAGAQRMIVVNAARNLAHDAVEAAGQCERGADAWHFYHGVETAAQHVLHPESASVREGTSWLDAETPSFREGFLEASTVLATAASAPEPPLRVHLPRPRRP